MKTITNESAKSGFTSFLKLSMIAVCLFGFVDIQSQTINQYAAEDVAQLMADMTAGAYDIYELTSSGATYVLTSSGLTPVAPPKSFTLRAADFLTEKPVIQYSATTTSTTRYMFYPSATITATFIGVKVNGNNPLGGTGNLGQPNFIRTYTTSVNSNIVIRNCDFYNFAQTSGLFRIDGAGTSLDIQGSTFKNCVGNIINFQTASINYGALTVKNCTFSDMTGATAMISYGNGSTGTNVLIDHCTMANFNTSREILIFKTLSSLQIKNSLFSSIYGGFSFANPAPTIDYCYLDGFATAPTGNITNSFTGTAPAFENPSIQNYALTNKNSFICGDGLPAGNTMYYVEVPTAQQATSINVNGFTANWLSVTDAVGYEVLLYQGETLVSTNYVAAPALNFVYTGLTTDVTYTYKVKAKNNSGYFSLLSDGMNATPSPSTGTSGLYSHNQVRVVGSTLMFSESGNVEVFNLQGSILIKKHAINTIETKLQSGIYLLRFTNEKGNQYFQKFFIR